MKIEKSNCELFEIVLSQAFWVSKCAIRAVHTRARFANNWTCQQIIDIVDDTLLQ